MDLGFHLLPGFRFFPTDEELVAFYLKHRAFSEANEGNIIGDLDIYKFEPYDLPNLAVHKSRDGQWYFFAPRTKKNANSARSGRSTAMGYWKATGKDREVYSHGVRMGMKKTLVYYKGRAPNGQRTDWIMHEYRLDEEYERKKKVLSGCVVCKVFKKGGRGPRNGEQYGAPVEDIDDDETSNALHFGESSCLSGFEVESVEEKIEFSSALSTQSATVKQEEIATVKQEDNVSLNPIPYSNRAPFNRQQTAGPSNTNVDLNSTNTLSQNYHGLNPTDSTGLKNNSIAFPSPNVGEGLDFLLQDFNDEANILEEILLSVSASQANPSQKTADDSYKFSIADLGLGPDSVDPLDAEVKVMIVGGLMLFAPSDFQSYIQAGGGRDHGIVNRFGNTCVTSSFAENALQMHRRMNQARYVVEAGSLLNTKDQRRHFAGDILARYGFSALPCLMVSCNAMTVYLEKSKGPCCLNPLLTGFVCNIALGDNNSTLFGTQYDGLIVQVLGQQQWRISSPHLHFSCVASLYYIAYVILLASGIVLCSVVLTAFVQSFYGQCLKLYSYVLGLGFDEYGFLFLFLLKQLFLSTAHVQICSGKFCNADLIYDSFCIISSFSHKSCIGFNS